MIGRLILKDIGKIQLGAAFFGSAAGFLLLLGAVQLYLDITESLFEEPGLIDPDYIVINKQLSLLSSANSKASEFTENEIEDIKNQPFTSEVAPFISNNFSISANTQAMGSIPRLYSEIFFEAVPDKFLDIKSDEWKWEPGDSIIPVILPKDYLNLYNFGFAQSKGLPQVSPKMIGRVAFDVHLKGRNKRQLMVGKIVGFSHRINSILAPYDFLKWANSEFKGASTNKRPSRLLIVSGDPSNPEIITFLDDRNYETNTEKLRNSRLNVLLRIILGIVGFIAFIIILLAFFVFILGFQLMITRSREKLRTLLHLGYGRLKLSSYYIIFFLIIVIAINAVSFAALWFIKTGISDYMGEYGFDITGGFQGITLILALGISFIIAAANSLFIFLQLTKTAKS